MTKNLRIGELAQRTRLTSPTIRYYETLELLPKPQRAENGYRLYGKADVDRLGFIQRGKRLGLSLEEIGGLLPLAQEGECDPLRQKVEKLIREKLRETAAKIAELQIFQRDLEHRFARLQHRSAHEHSCTCQDFDPSCECLPVTSEEALDIPATLKVYPMKEWR